MSFDIYKSSAGSGKTYTLVKEYLTILLRNPQEYNKVLAITFTNKAANEMRQRVIHTLRFLSGYPATGKPPADALIHDLKTQTGIKSNAVLKLKSRQALSLILHNYSEFSIGTIDSFVHNIVKTFAHDLKLPYNFEVELDRDLFIHRVVDLLIGYAGQDPKLTRALIQFTESRTDFEENWNIESAIHSFASKMLSEDSYPYLKKLRHVSMSEMDSLNMTLNRLIHRFYTILHQKAAGACALAARENLSDASFFQGSRGILSFFRKVRDHTTDAGIQKIVYSMLEKDSWAGPKASPTEAASLRNIQEELKRILKEIAALLENDHPRIRIYEMIRRNIYPMAILNEIEKVIDEYRTEENRIHISEINRLISDVIAKESVPFIYERIGEKYRNYLIDEFQDTSVLQWNNLLPLVHNALASGYFCLVVGDAKQAIYRWREGDAEQFIRLPEIGADPGGNADARGALMKAVAKERPLNKNYRSARQIVQFNNEFFGFLSSKLPKKVGNVYSGSRQAWAGKDPGGYVEIRWIDAGDDNKAYEKNTQDAIHEQVDHLSTLNYRFSDMAILCRTNKEGSAIAGYLLEHGIRVVSADSLLLMHSPDVKFLVSCMYVLTGSRDPVFVLQIVYYLHTKNWFGATDFDQLMDGMFDMAPGSFLSSLFKKISLVWPPAGWQNLSLYDLAETIIRLFRLDHGFNPYIQVLLDGILKIGAGRKNSIQAWLHWWEENKNNLSLKMPEDLDAVRVMTIHKAKGLEFPAVIYPYADESFPPTRLGKEEVWLDLDDPDLPGLPAALIPVNRKLEGTRYEKIYTSESEKSCLDAVNRSYVTMTRAVKSLCIIQKRPDAKGSSSNAMSKFMNNFVQERGFPVQGSRVRIGTEEPYKPSSREEPRHMLDFDAFLSVDWRRRVLMSMQAPGYWDTGSPDKHRQWGTLVHRVLSGITYKEDAERVVKHFEIDGFINVEEADIIRKVLKKVLESPEMSFLFSPDWNVKNECEILDSTGNIHRPDRLLMRGNDAVIVDYKTGTHNPAYRFQLEKYARLVESMGMDVKGMYLLYLNEKPDIVRI